MKKLERVDMKLQLLATTASCLVASAWLSSGCSSNAAATGAGLSSAGQPTLTVTAGTRAGGGGVLAANGGGASGATVGAAGAAGARAGTTGSVVAAGSTAITTAGAGAAGTGAPAAAGAAAGSGGALAGNPGVEAGAGSAAQAGAGGGATEACTPPASSDTDPCTAPLKPNDDRLCKMMIDGQMREFYIYASPKYDPCTPASMIMDCHGLSESIEVHIGKEGFNLSGQMFPSGYGSGWRMAVQRDNAIVVTPAGLNQSWTTSTDVPFVNKVADHVETIAKVNPDHVYVTGISMGGMMTVAVGCDDAKRWRGMSPVAMLTQSCSKLDRPTPTISFHSMTDQLTSYASDRSTMESIARFNNCKTGPTDSLRYGGSMSLPDAVCYAMSNGVGDPDAPDPYNIPLVPCSSSLPETTCVTWSDCDEGVEVVFCTVPASSQPIGGHILYNNDGNLDLAEVAWPFFKKFWK